LTELVPYPKSNALYQLLSIWVDGVDVCHVHEGPSGTFDSWGLIAGGFLTTEGRPVPDTVSTTVTMSLAVKLLSDLVVLLEYYHTFDLTILFQPYVYNKHPR